MVGYKIGQLFRAHRRLTSTADVWMVLHARHIGNRVFVRTLRAIEEGYARPYLSLWVNVFRGAFSLRVVVRQPSYSAG